MTPRLVCPVCEDSAVMVHGLVGPGGGHRAARRVDCLTCGTFDVTEMMVVNLKRVSAETRYQLSAMTRAASDRGTVLELSTGSEARLQEAPRPDALERVALLLRHLASRSGESGSPVALDLQRDYPVVHAHGAEGFARLVGDAVRQGLVEQSIADTTVLSRVTLAGHQWLEERSRKGLLPASGIQPKIERSLSEARQRLREAQSEEQFQAVGLLCRETLISVAQAVYDAPRHGTLDGKEASRSDAKRMLEAVIATELGGKANEEVRAHAKAAVQLAVALQHDRTADFRDAAMCVEATAFVARIITIVVGKP